jgi:hypothetical protein
LFRQIYHYDYQGHIANIDISTSMVLERSNVESLSGLNLVSLQDKTIWCSSLMIEIPATEESPVASQR